MGPRLRIRKTGEQTVHLIEVTLEDENGQPIQKLTEAQRKQMAESILNYMDQKMLGEPEN